MGRQVGGQARRSGLWAVRLGLWAGIEVGSAGRHGSRDCRQVGRLSGFPACRVFYRVGEQGQAIRVPGVNVIFSCLIAVAINLIVQHIQDILNGDLCKRHRGGPNGRNYKRTFPEPGEHPGVLATGKRSHLESSSRPH